MILSNNNSNSTIILSNNSYNSTNNTNNNVFIGNSSNTIKFNNQYIHSNYNCNPEEHLNKVLYLTADQIYCFRIIIAYYINNNGHKNAIGIPYLGISLKFPNYMFYIASYKFDSKKNIGIYELIIYKMPHISYEILNKALSTHMWIQYYDSFIRHMNYITENQRITIMNFNQKINYERLISLYNNVNHTIDINYNYIIAETYDSV
jgi:hypothetical protein